MATRLYRGVNAAIKQVDTATPANVGVADVFTLTLTDYRGYIDSIAFTATAATVANVTAGLVALANDAKANGGDSPWTLVTASDQTTYMDVTADAGGFGFTLAATEADGDANDTQTHIRAAVTANSGPGVYTDTDNWETQTAPVSTDDVIITKEFRGHIIGSDQKAVLLGDFTVEKGCSANIGTPNNPLRIDADNVYMYGSGEIYLRIDNSTVIIVDGAANVHLSGDANNVDLWVRLDSGQVCTVANVEDDTMTITNVHLDGDGTIILGDGLTISTALNIAGSGKVDTWTGTTTVNKTGGGTWTHWAGAITTVNDEGSGSFINNTTDTIGTTYMGPDAMLDISQSQQARTMTTIYLSSPKLKDPNKNLAWTSLYLTRCGVSDPGDAFDLGAHMKLTRGAYVFPT